MKRFADLSEQEILALAISNEDEDSRIYRGFAEGLREAFPASAKVFDEMADEEVRHRTMLYRHVPLEIRRISAADPPPGRQRLHPPQQAALADAAARPRRGAQVRRDAWNTRPSASIARPRRRPATSRSASCSTELAEIEAEHESLAQKLGETILTKDARAKEDETAAPHVPAAIRAAGAGRPDGRLGLDAGAGVRRGLRHPQHLGDIPGRAWRPRSAPASRWDSPRRCPTTARSPGAARPGFAARCAG